MSHCTSYIAVYSPAVTGGVTFLCASYQYMSHNSGTQKRKEMKRKEKYLLTQGKYMVSSLNF